MRSIYNYILAACAILLIGIAGTYLTSSVGVTQDAPALRSDHSAAGKIEGIVLDMVDVPGYTYVQVEIEGKSVWAAAPSVPVQIGDTVSFATNMPMVNFYSNSLQREFELIYFVDRFVSDGGTSSIDSEAASAHGRMGVQEAFQPVQKFSKAAGGYTVAEVLAQSDDLEGKPVRVRGQVVKFTPNVMSTNWLRIMDGSSNQHLIVPTEAAAAINDVVLVEGKLAINLDVGQGFVLPTVLQDAEVMIEQ
jgi:hypothetical protein